MRNLISVFIAPQLCIAYIQLAKTYDTHKYPQNIACF